MLVDIHTHRSVEDNEGVIAVMSCHPCDIYNFSNFDNFFNFANSGEKGTLSPTLPQPAVNQRFSVGIHPWRVNVGWKHVFDAMVPLFQRSDVVAVGECGLDRVRGIDLSVQLDCFEAHLDLAESLSKPVIVHCVKAIDELLAMRRLHPHVQMIVHGFRGKPTLAHQLLQAGMELSFGPYFNADSLRLAYGERRMWLETDDSGWSIAQVYDRAASALSISPTDISLPGTLAL